MTSPLLYMHYQNTIVGRCDGKQVTRCRNRNRSTGRGKIMNEAKLQTCYLQALCERIEKWVEENQIWVEGMVRKHRHRDPYWHQVRN